MSTSIGSKPIKKTAQITDSLRQLAKEVGPEGKLPTYVELLGILGVSRTTLNTALEELERQGVIYRRQGAGIFVTPKKRRPTVALVCNPTFFQGRTHSPFWDILLEQARDRAAADALDSEVHFCKWDDPDALPFSDTLLHSCGAGLAQGVIGVGMNRASANWLASKGIPYVGFGGPAHWYVGIDRNRLIQMGVQELATRGCQRIALIDAVTPLKKVVLEDIEAKAESFGAALEQFKLDFVLQLMRLNLDLVQTPDGMTTLTPQEQGHRSLHQIYADTNITPPDGLLLLDDRVTVGVLAAMKERHLAPAHDLQVVTHSNRGTTVLAPYEGVITRLEVDPAQIVNTMFSTISDLLSQQTPQGFVASADSEQKSSLIPPVLLRPAD